MISKCIFFEVVLDLSGSGTLWLIEQHNQVFMLYDPGNRKCPRAGSRPGISSPIAGTHLRRPVQSSPSVAHIRTGARTAALFAIPRPHLPPANAS
jgi:hypothetical protein